MVIESAIQGFIRAYNAGDLEGVLAYYADDLINVRHGAAAEPKSVTAERLAAAFEQFECYVEMATDEIRTRGDLAFTRGSCRFTLIPRRGGEPKRIDRRFLEIWRQDGEGWKLLRTMDDEPSATESK